MRKKSTKEDERGKYKMGRQRRSERDTQTNREQLMEATLRDLSSNWQGSHPLYTLRASQTGSSQGSLSNACFCIMGLGLCFLVLPGFIIRAFVWSSSQTFPNQKQNKREWERGSRGGREKWTQSYRSTGDQKPSYCSILCPYLIRKVLQKCKHYWRGHRWCAGDVTQ